MRDPYLIPRIQAAMVRPDGLPDPAWWNFLNDMYERLAAGAIVGENVYNEDGTLFVPPVVPPPYVPPPPPYTPPGGVIDGGTPGGGTIPGGTVPINPVNPGFESDLLSWEAGAVPTPVVSSTWAVINDPPNAHSGDKFLRWTGDSTPSGGGLEGLTYINTTNVDSPGVDLLTVDIWARVQRPTTDGVGLVRAAVGIEKYSPGGSFIGNTVAGAVALFGASLDSGWVQISTFTEKIDGIGYFRAYVIAQGPAGAIVDFDDLSWNGTEPTP